jgi:hypothetical protein
MEKWFLKKKGLNIEESLISMKFFVHCSKYPKFFLN